MMTPTSRLSRRTVARAGLLCVIAMLAVLALAYGAPTARAGFDDSSIDANAQRVRQSARRASLIVVGAVSSVGTRPIAWSGFLRIDQTATYTIDHLVKGNFTSATISVQHMVVGGSRNADTSPGLSLTRFATGQKLIVSLAERAGRYYDLDEDFGTLPYSANNESALRALLVHEVDLPLSSNNSATRR
jgi:hypothetical protein